MFHYLVLQKQEKSLIARTICDIFNVQPKIIHGHEIFGRFLGESEAKIRALLADVRRDQQILTHRNKIHIDYF